MRMPGWTGANANMAHLPNRGQLPVDNNSFARSALTGATAGCMGGLMTSIIVGIGMVAGVAYKSRAGHLASDWLQGTGILCIGLAIIFAGVSVAGAMRQRLS